MTAPHDCPAAPTADPRCGMKAGHSAHLRRGEQPCAPCRAANRRAVSEYRDRARAALAEPSHASCGTRDGVSRHQARGERLCGRCRAVQKMSRGLSLSEPRPRPPLPDRAALSEAACFPWTGSHDSRRPDETDEEWNTRLTAARRTCRSCPVFDACDQLKEHYRGRVKGVDGILAGQPTRQREKPL